MLSIKDIDSNYFFLYILISLSWWALCYALTRLIFANHAPEWCCRLVTLFHGSSSALFGLQECFGSPYPFSSKHILSTARQKLILINSAGYFMEDLIWCLRYRTESMLMLVHHMYSCVALTRMAMRETAAGQACCILGGAEITNPLLQMRWFIRSAGYWETPLFVAMELTFVTTFFVVRIVLGTILMMTADSDTECWLLSLFIYVLSWLFMYNIINYIRTKFFLPVVTVPAQARPEAAPAPDDHHIINAES